MFQGRRKSVSSCVSGREGCSQWPWQVRPALASGVEWHILVARSGGGKSLSVEQDLPKEARERGMLPVLLKEGDIYLRRKKMSSEKRERERERHKKKVMGIWIDIESHLINCSVVMVGMNNIGIYTWVMERETSRNDLCIVVRLWMETWWKMMRREEKQIFQGGRGVQCKLLWHWDSGVCSMYEVQVELKACLRDTQTYTHRVSAEFCWDIEKGKVERWSLSVISE